jgi:altronate hydrolase
MNATNPQTLRLHARDDVVIATTALSRGALLETDAAPIVLAQHVAPGHKIAIGTLAVGDPVHRYGQIIGVASAPIRPGDHVHVHNLRSPGPMAQGQRDRASEGSSEDAPSQRAPSLAQRHFDGYVRPDGRVGTRNYIAILSTVNCSATVCHLVRDRFRDVTRDYPNVDGVIAITHKAGCGHVAGGEDHMLLERVLAGYARHPNVAAYIVIGLGCEVAQAAPMVQRHRLSLLSEEFAEAAPVLTIQGEGGVRKTVDAAVAAISKLLPVTDRARRTRRPAADLILGTNCGGSDGYSGITANPALGRAFDALVDMGGTGVLAETTELFGAEHLLVQRAKDPAVAKKLMDRMAWWRNHLQMHGVDVGSNPSPGNIWGGITTITEKSLGAVAKSGTSTLNDVIEYGERIREKGFVYMDTPGYDPVSVTGLVAGGVNVLCFTTGRGSVFGCKPVPSIKLATNSELYRRMEDDMDIDCGVILEGRSLDEVGRDILEEILAVASGKRTKSELAGLGEAEFAPWMRGPVL